MALGFYFSPGTPMSAQTYDECIARLRQAGAAHPKGRVYHAAFGSKDRLAVFDVWTSQAEFDAFGQTLMPILQALGVDAGQPQVMEIHSVIVPPAAKASAKKRAPIRPPRRAAAKKKAVKKAAPKKWAAKRAGKPRSAKVRGR
jgi:hypothetical protein